MAVIGKTSRTYRRVEHSPQHKAIERVKQSFLYLLMCLVPKRHVSAWVGRLVHYQLPPPFNRLSVRFFASMYRIALEEAEWPIERYPTIGDLFVRRLKPGARPIGQAPVHPADALITESGRIEQGTLLQCKGHAYALADLLGDAQVAAYFEHGSFVTYYLCPTDYHRVHAPVDGEVIWSCHIPGELWPVNGWSVRTVEQVFCVNERVVTLLQTAQGEKVAVVMVAATNVGDITLAYDSTITTTGHQRSRAKQIKTYQPPRPLRTGEELGVFHMGSTVVVLFAPGGLDFDPTLLRGQRATLGVALRTHVSSAL